MFVYHVDDETVYFNNGAVHAVIPPKEVVEIKNDYDAKVCLHEKAFHGLVEVHLTRSPQGMTFDIESAHQRSTILLEEESQKMLRAFVEAQFEDRIKLGKPALPPGKGSRVAKLVAKYKVDFKKDFGLEIVSVDAAKARQQAVSDQSALIARQEALEAENADLRAKFNELLAQLKAKIDNENEKEPETDRRGRR